MFPGRTTKTDVLRIIDTSLTDIDLFIDMANDLVSECCVTPNVAVTYSDHRLFLIETLVAAHFVSLEDQRVSHERVDVLSQSFQHKVDLRLQVTEYGQQAMIMDTQLGLARVNNSAALVKKLLTPVGITWLGKKHCYGPGGGFDLPTEDFEEE